jgi:autotransporter-associated beta strand protein
MTTAHARAVPFVFANLRLSLMATASASLLVALAPAANAAPDCAAGTSGDDVCIITLNNTATENVDALGQTTTDRLQFGGASNFSFDVGRIGATGGLVNFEVFEKIDAVTVTLTGTATAVTPWTVSAGTLLVTGHTASGAGNIGDTSSVTIANGATFGLIGAGGNSEAIGSLAGVAGSSVTLGGTGILTAGGNGTNTTFAGVMSGTGGFTKTGSGTMILSGANTFTGALSVTGGVLEIGNADAISTASGVTIADSTLSSKGAFANYTINGPVTITTSTALSRLTGNAVINGNLRTNGGLQPGHTSVPTWPTGTTGDNPGQDMGQITINGNYEATGGFAYVGMFIDIDAALAVVNPNSNGTNAVTHDFLTINGNMVGTQSTKFSVASFDEVPVGGSTTGNGIQVIRITGTSANAGNEFFQGNALVAGPHQYLLRYVANYSGGDDGYFLQSTARDELVAHAGLLSAGQSLIRGCFRDDQRIPDSPKGATYGRAWFGYRQGNASFGADTGVEQDQDFSCSTGGMDWRMGHGWFGGVSGGFGSSNSDITVPSGVADLDGDARVIEAYAAFTSSAFFLNLSAGYADMDWALLGRLGSAETTSSGFIGSAQAGIGLGLEPLAVKLIGMVSYDGTNCGDDCFGIASTEDTGLIEAKGALRFDGVTWGGSIRPWAQVAYSTILSDGVNTVSAGPYTIVSDTNDELLTFDAGLQSYLDENLAIYLDGGYNESLSKDISGYRASIGAKLYW